MIRGFRGIRVPPLNLDASHRARRASARVLEHSRRAAEGVPSSVHVTGRRRPTRRTWTTGRMYSQRLAPLATPAR